MPSSSTPAHADFFYLVQMTRLDYGVKQTNKFMKKMNLPQRTSAIYWDFVEYSKTLKEGKTKAAHAVALENLS